ncbi:MAG TPA: hemolysin family protein [candidate division Zixibacteria bacterium]
MLSSWIEIILILVLIVANGFFVSAEIALISLRRSKVRQLIDQGRKNAKLIKKLQDEPYRFLATIQIGITLIGTLAAVVGGAELVDLIRPLIQKIPLSITQKGSEPVAIGVVVILIAYFSLVLGELVPKYFALSYSEKIATKVAKPIYLLSRLSFLIVKLLSASSRLVTHLLIGKTLIERSFIGEEEIKYIISEGKEKGVFEPTEEELIHRVFEFTDTYVRTAMTPRNEIAALDIDTPQEKVIQTILEKGYSRIPVYKNNLDNVVGIIYVKDVINILQNNQLIILNDIIREPYFVPDSRKITQLLKEFQAKKIHIAIVQDKFGGTAGLITLEDILEEIVGEIRDEYDQEAELIQMLSDGSAIISVRTSLEDFNKKFETKLPQDKFGSVGDYLTHHLGRIPALDEEIEIGNLKFIIFEKSTHRLSKIRVTKLPKK